MPDLAPLVSGVATARVDGLARALERMDRLIARALQTAIQAGTRDLGTVVTAAGEAVSLDDLGRIDQEWRRQLAAKILPELGKSYNDGADYTANELIQLGAKAGGGVDFTMPAGLAYMASADADLRDVGTETWGRLRLSLATGMQEGEGIPELTDRVRDEIAGSTVQARRIARTNVIGASAAGSLEQAKALSEPGNQPLKVWLATSDTRTRESHWLASGQQRTLDEPFSVGGARMMFPGDPAGPDSEKQNCRCTLTWEFDPSSTVDEQPAQVQEAQVLEGEPVRMPADKYVLADRNQRAYGDARVSLDANAKAHDMTPAQYRQACDEKIKHELNRKQIGSHQPAHVARKILHGDRFKNQFETKTSGGYIDSGNVARRNLEREVFGINSDDPRAHPIYAAFTDAKAGGRVDFEGADAYGPIKFVFKDEVRDRTTWTAVDSLGDTMQMTVGNAGSPSMDGWFLRSGYVEDPLNWNGTPSNIGSSYIEAQIHGPTDINHVSSVFVSRRDTDIKEAMRRNREVRERLGSETADELVLFLEELDRSGIPWFMQTGTYGNETWIPGSLA